MIATAGILSNQHANCVPRSFDVHGQASKEALPLVAFRQPGPDIGVAKEIRCLPVIVNPRRNPPALRTVSARCQTYLHSLLAMRFLACNLVYTPL